MNIGIIGAGNIGSALAGREVARHLREIGAATRGPAPMAGSDRSRFLAALETEVQAAIRVSAGEPMVLTVERDGRERELEVTPIENLQASLALCAPAVSQVGGRAAFSTEARAELEAPKRSRWRRVRTRAS